MSVSLLPSPSSCCPVVFPLKTCQLVCQGTECLWWFEATEEVSLVVAAPKERPGRRARQQSSSLGWGQDASKSGQPRNFMQKQRLQELMSLNVPLEISRPQRGERIHFALSPNVIILTQSPRLSGLHFGASQIRIKSEHAGPGQS